MSEIRKGVPAWVAIRSLRGSNLKLENPWESAWCDGKEYASAMIEMPTTAGSTYFFTPAADLEMEFEQEQPETNHSCKVSPDRDAMLGLERSF